MVDPKLTLQDLRLTLTGFALKIQKFHQGETSYALKLSCPITILSKALHLQLKYHLLDHLHVFSLHIAIWTCDKKPQAAACDCAHDQRPHPTREPKVWELVGVSSIYQC